MKTITRIRRVINDGWVNNLPISWMMQECVNLHLHRVHLKRFIEVELECLQVHFEVFYDEKPPPVPVEQRVPLRPEEVHMLKPACIELFGHEYWQVLNDKNGNALIAHIRGEKA